ncbi:MAG: ABC transporter substrate-binding protein [Gammaproteobacteria bacterium]|nr:ABC transporter substrate-binding protein [Gammaproteobacteria bacterium]
MVGIIPYLPAGEFIVADRKGFYKEEGLDVDSIYYTSTGDWVRALAKGKLHFSGLWNATQVDMYYRGSNAKRIALMSFDSGDYSFIVKKGLTPANLVGKRVAVFSDYFGTHWFIHNYMKSGGRSLNDVQLIEMTNSAAYKNFNNDRVAGMIFNGKYMNQALDTGRGAKAKIDQDLYLAATTGGPSYFGNEEDLTRSELKKFLRAWVKAMKWIEDDKNDDEYEKMLKSAFEGHLELVGLEKEASYRERKPRKMLVSLKDMYVVNKNMGAMFEKLVSVRSDMGFSDTPNYVKSKMYDNSLILEVLEEMGYGKKGVR